MLLLKSTTIGIKTEMQENYLFYKVLFYIVPRVLKNHFYQ